MQDKSNCYQVEPVPTLTPPKRLGSYLVDAGLLSADQVNVALNDQRATGMRFGEILVAHGWLKEQTIEWVMKRVVEPERKHRLQQATPPVARPRSLEVLRTAAADRAYAAEPTADTPQRPRLRRELPISKPLPSVKSSDSDVNWVG